MQRSPILPHLLITAAACILFLPFLGHVHLFDWDEINFAECAREMITTKDYLRPQIDFMPFWEKPPLFMWLQVLAMKLFGIGEFAARLPDAVTGVVTLNILYYVGKRLASTAQAWWWVVLYAASWLPHFYFKTGIIDPVFNLFIFLAFFQFYLLRTSGRAMLHAMLCGLFLGLAVLTKGPVAILVAGLAVLADMAMNRGAKGYKLPMLLVIGFFAALPMAGWLLATIITYGGHYGSWFINEFITYQVRLFRTEDADHGGPFVYHFIVLLVGCFPASAFLLQYSFRNKLPERSFTKWMWVLFWVVLLLFSVVKTKIVHYSSLCYFPLTWLAASVVVRIQYGDITPKRWVMRTLRTIALLLGIVITLLPLVGIFKQELIPSIDDKFAVANLQANVPWSYLECLWGLAYLGGMLYALRLFATDFKKAMIVLCAVQVVIIQAAVLHFTPKIEAYSQRAAIDYFKGLQGKKVYVHALGYKSYATMFYARTMPATNPKYKSMRMDVAGNSIQPEANEQWLLNGDIDQPAYFLCKIQDRWKYDPMPQLEKLGEQNGFVFYRRTLSK